MKAMKLINPVIFSVDETYCSEEYFQRMLILERKRSEQSGKTFMLILLDIDKLLKGNLREKEVVLQKIALALDSSTCEIDTKGWYIRNCIIGIICRDIQKGDGDSIPREIAKKLYKGPHVPPSAKNPDPIKMLRLFYPNAPGKRHSKLNSERIHHKIRPVLRVAPTRNS